MEDDMKKFHVHLNRQAPDYAIVMSTVRDVLKQNYIKEPPVVPQELCESYGIKVLFVEFSAIAQKVSGFLNLEDETIYVNKTESPQRQIFTMAHELGHFLLHKDLFTKHPDEYKVLMRAPLGASQDPLEKEANAFAAHLLVPADFLRRYIKIATISELARLFSVSEDVIRFRIEHETQRAFA